MKTLILLFAAASIAASQTVHDIDGNVYTPVVINGQVWLKENLMAARYQDGTLIPGAAAYNDNDSMRQIYGLLYSWDAAMHGSTSPGAQGACPCGWHIPTDQEWTVLEISLGGTTVAGGKMKEAGLNHWSSPNTGATNISGFSALPAGEYDGSVAPGFFQFINRFAVFWTSTPITGELARERYLSYNNASSLPYDWYKSMKYSIRCVKDTVHFGAAPASGYAPLTVHFNSDDVCLQGVTSWGWDCDGDGQVDAMDSSPDWTYPDTGSFTVRLIVSNGTETDTLLRPGLIHVFKPAIPDFSASPRAGYAPLTVGFTDLSTPQSEIQSRDWDFRSDGIIGSHAVNPVWTYSAPGTYSVRLIVFDGFGYDTVVKPAYITVRQKCTASFTASPLAGYRPLTVHFTDSSTPDSSIVSWSWDFTNDGIIDSHDRDPLWTYKDTGKFSVRLIVSDGTMSDTLVRIGYIRVIDTCHAAFGALPLSGPQPLVVMFTDESTPPGSIVSWDWDFDANGSIDSHDRNPVWTYPDTGKFTVRLVVGDGVGMDTLTKSACVAVYPKLDMIVRYNPGWNLVSCPVQANERTVLPSLFLYDGKYVRSDSMTTGRGYWAVPGDSVKYTGDMMIKDTVAVTAKWNIIGSISRPVAVEMVGSVPAGLILSGFYAYKPAGGYVLTDTVFPGAGYWVKASQPGYLVLGGIEHRGEARVNIIPDGEPPPAPPNKETRGCDISERALLTASHPNPFNPSTSIVVTLREQGFITLRIYDALGRLVAGLAEGYYSSGRHTFLWEAAGIPSGVYYCRMTAGVRSETIRIICAR